MKLISYMVKKVGLGFLYGIGFGVSAGVIYYFVSEAIMESVWNEEALNKIVVTKHEKFLRGDSVQVLGTIENQSAESVRLVNIQVDLFDKDGKFVEQCEGYVKGAIRAGESINFKVSCNGCKNKPVPEHETYKVRIVGM